MDTRKIEALDDVEQPGEAAQDVEQTPEAPRQGTLAWLLLQPRIEYQGVELPACHRIPEGGGLAIGAEPGRCSVVRADGRPCKAVSLRAFPTCLVHAGGGGFSDPSAMSRRANAVKIARRERRELLGIGSRRSASPRQIARVQAMERAEALASAIVSRPLDDPSLGTIERQIAALRALDATFPLASTSVELSIPADGSDVQGMGWAEMRALASQLLDSNSESAS
jgi:hypothetical protein